MFVKLLPVDVLKTSRFKLVFPLLNNLLTLLYYFQAFKVEDDVDEKSCGHELNFWRIG